MCIDFPFKSVFARNVCLNILNKEVVSAHKLLLCRMSQVDVNVRLTVFLR